MRRASVGLAANLRSLPGAQASHPRPATCPVLCYPMNADVNRPSGLTQCQARMQGDHVSGLGSKPRGARRVALKSPSGPPPGCLEIPGTAHVDGGGNGKHSEQCDSSDPFERQSQPAGSHLRLSSALGWHCLAVHASLASACLRAPRRRTSASQPGCLLGGSLAGSSPASQPAALLATCRPGGDRLRRWSRYLGLGSRARCGGITACFDSPSPEHRSGLSVHAMVFHFYRFVTPGEVM